MKLNYKCLREILENLEKCEESKSRIIQSDLHDAAEVYHYKILIDEGFVEGKVSRIQHQGKDTVLYFIHCDDLTWQGHKLLEVLRNDKLWGKTKSNLKAFGVESLKQIPVIAIDVLVKMIGQQIN